MLLLNADHSQALIDYLLLSYNITMYSRYMLLFFSLLSMVCSQSFDDSGKLSFKTPELNDEEGHSPWIPSYLRCDACQAVAYQLWSHFDKYNAKHKYRKYNLKEWEVLDIVEHLCADSDIFNNYGIKEVNGVHRLSGIGLSTYDLPGVIAGGGKWPLRLQDMCEEFMGEVGEDQMYDVYKKDPDNSKQLEEFLCYGPVGTIRGQCKGKHTYVEEEDEEAVIVNEEL